MKKIVIIIFSVLSILGISSCGIYSFSGTSIQPDVKSFTVEPFENNAMKINPQLANLLTESLIDKYTNLTNLEMSTDNGDLRISGIITSYNIAPTAITADEIASQNRLTITVKIKYTNRLHPEEDMEQSFSGFSNYDSSVALDAIESSLCEEITDRIVEEIFNATVANW
ncbi:MAG: LptE family protein [Bacteroidales bacterium]